MYTHILLMQFLLLSRFLVLVKVSHLNRIYFSFHQNQTVIGHTVICEERQDAPYDHTTATLLCAIPSLVFCVHGNKYNLSVISRFLFFCACTGVHRCYLGDVGIGVCQCATLGLCGIWSLIDLLSMRQVWVLLDIFFNSLLNHPSLLVRQIAERAFVGVEFKPLPLLFNLLLNLTWCTSQYKVSTRPEICECVQISKYSQDMALVPLPMYRILSINLQRLSRRV